MKCILVTGANGQIGSELVEVLRSRSATEVVVSTDLEEPSSSGDGPHEILDVCDEEALEDAVERHRIDTVFHLASLLSARGEAMPDRTWQVNIDGLKNVLDRAREHDLKVFWPSSIAAFGPATGLRAPQRAVLDPQTMYGVTKVSGELLCRYYHRRYGVDVRSVRYPGLISHRTLPGGGTTDYATEMFYAAAAGEAYTCFVRPDTRLPMVYMPDALRAALELMSAAPDALSVRTSYNVGAMDFTAEALATALQERVPAFSCRYEPDERQEIADSWPSAVEDAPARQDWHWDPSYDLEAMTTDMLAHLSQRSRFEAETSSQG